MQESRMGNISRNLTKTNNEPQIISATMNNEVYSASQVRMGTQIGCHESTQIVDSTGNDNTGQSFDPSDTQQVFVQYKNLHKRRIAHNVKI